MVIGLHGTNVAGAPTVPIESGFQVWDGALDFDNVNGAQPGPGIFGNNYDMAQFGISANYPADILHGAYDNCVFELFAYVYSRPSGVYTFVIGTDDSAQLSIASNPLDRMGTVIYNPRRQSFAQRNQPSGRPRSGQLLHRSTWLLSNAYPL